MGKAKKILRYFVVIVAFLLVLVWFGMTKQNTNCKEHLDTVEEFKLGPQASDISYYKLRTIMDSRTVYEFTITEEGFLELAAKSKWAVEEISDKVTIGRYTQHCNTDGNVEALATINQGYAYRLEEGKLYRFDVVFDREDMRAYVYEKKRGRKKGKRK